MAMWHKQRMHTRWLAMTAVMVTAGASSSTARADCIVLAPAVLVPFDGLSLPANAELRVFGVFGTVELTGPDGNVQFVEVASDDRGQLLDLDVRTLSPGPYSFVINDRVEGTFDLRADDDTEAPAAPVVSFVDVTTKVAGPRLPIFDDCGSSPAGIRRTAIFQVDGGEPGDVVVVNGNIVGMGDTVTSRVGDDDDDDIAVALRDLAGNESEATIVPVVVEDGCGGCSSAAMSPFALALLTLFARRRR